MPLEESSGYAGVAVVSGLQPDRRYYYSLTLEDTPPRLRLTNYPSFTTVPVPGTASSFSFAFGSCFRPASPEGGRIFSTIDRMRESEGLRFILLLGDQIYADAYQYNGIKRVACSLQDYRDVYESTWSRPPFRALLQNLPAYMTLDDHEVDDDWRWADARRRQGILPIWDRLERWIHGRPPNECRLSLQRIQAALQAYWEHQGMHSPGLEIPPQLDAFGKYALHPEDPGSLAHSFTFGAAAFFVLDTRTNRISNRQERTMLGEGQWQALKSWLKTVKDAYPVKFLVSSCSLLHPLYFDFPRDRWSGFPDERDRLLHFLAANGIQGVYVLAGDLHSSHAVYAELYGPEGRSLPLWEFCSTPFEQSPNKLARWTYAPLRSGPVRSSKRAFHVGQCNFGVVRVSYEGRKPPAVSFTVYGEQGDVLAKAGSES
jgi:phosphodiesterase/alkaline phosphatase D-like protein